MTVRDIEIGAGGEETPPLEGYLQVDLQGQPDVRADMRTLPFRRLERIHASHVLEHLPDADIVMALKSCRRALRAGGVLEVYVPDLLWTVRRFINSKMSYGERWGLWLQFIYGSQKDEGQYHKTGFSTKRLADCLIAAGFRQVKVRRVKRERRFALMEIQGLATS